MIGPVAQLGARINRTDEVAGSNPARSTVAKRSFAYRRTGKLSTDSNAPFSIHLRGDDPLDMPIERFLASVNFEHRSKLKELGIELGSLGIK